MLTNVELKIICLNLLLLMQIHLSKSSAQTSTSKYKWSKINLPPSHMVFFFNSNEKLRLRCIKDDACPFKEAAAEAESSMAVKCWGYEANCSIKNRVFLPQCPGDSGGWVSGVVWLIQNKMRLKISQF